MNTNSDLETERRFLREDPDIFESTPRFDPE